MATLRPHILPVPSGLLLLSCNKIEDAVKFRLDFTSIATIPSNTTAELPVDFLTPERETNIEQEPENNDSL